MKPVITPNIPQSSVRLAAVSENAYDIISALEREGIEVVKIAPLDALPTPVSAHSDMQLLHLGGDNILTVKEAKYLKTNLTNFGFNIEELFTKIGDEYPQDISLNFLLLNNRCFGMSSIMPLQLNNYCDHAGLQVVHSKQGYARCSVAVVAKNAAITADATLYRLLTNADIDTLMVGSGDINLPGYGTGFIGGCCGLISKDRLAFTGSLLQYCYGVQVLTFLAKHRVAPVYLTNGKLMDIGGILPLMED